MTSSYELYLQSKDAVTLAITEENQSTIVPACPGWTLRDLLGHLAGAMEDLLAGNTDDLGAPHWTAAQVDRHRDLELDAVKAKWTASLESAGEAGKDVVGGAIIDLGIHEFEMRGALADTSNRDGELVAAMVPPYMGFVDRSFRANNLPALKLVMDVGDYVLGEGDPQGELHLSGFEFVRMVTGRRSLAQVRALDWSADATPWLKHMSMMPMRGTDLVE